MNLLSRREALVAGAAGLSLPSALKSTALRGATPTVSWHERDNEPGGIRNQ